MFQGKTSGRVYKAGTDEALGFPDDPDLSPSYKYPKKWFEEHPNQKPSVTLNLTSTCLEDARRNLKESISSGRINAQHVVTFIYYYGKGISAVLTDDWQSYGVLIGRKGQTVGPWDILNLEEKVVLNDGTNTKPAGTEDTNATAADDKWMMSLVMSKHHPFLISCGTVEMLKVQTEFDRRSVIKSVENAMKRDKGTTYSNVTREVNIGLGNRAYNMLVAAIDMFLNKFPSSSDADLRLGTQAARYRDCGAVLALQSLMEVTNIQDIKIIGQWMYTYAVHRQYGEIVNDEEWNKEHSYFPYQLYLSLVDKSPYTVIAKTYIFYFAHFVGALLGSERSMNTHYNENAVVAIHMLTNARAMAYALSRKEGDLKPGEPNSTKFEDWFVYLRKYNFETPAIQTFVEERATAMNHCRAKTVGGYLCSEGLHAV